MSETPALNAATDPTEHAAMRRFAEAVRTLYGERVERIVLYGSRARGDARETRTGTWRCFCTIWRIGGRARRRSGASRSTY